MGESMNHAIPKELVILSGVARVNCDSGCGVEGPAFRPWPDGILLSGAFYRERAWIWIISDNSSIGAAVPLIRMSANEWET